MLAEMGSIVEAVNVGKDSPLGVCLTRQNPLGRPLPLEAGVEGFSTGIIPVGARVGEVLLCWQMGNI